MNRLFAAVGLGALLLITRATTEVMAADAVDLGFKLMQTESLGGLKLDMKAEEITKLLGKAEQTGKEENWDAIGEWVQRWDWPKQGISAKLSSKKKGGTKKLLMVTITAPSDRATLKGIHVGSTEAEVQAAYGSFKDKEASKAHTTFVAGSVYGGLTFQFTKGKVSEIFVGASAE